MSTQTLLSGVTATGAGPVRSLQNCRGGGSPVVTVDGITVATVEIQGRLTAGSGAWIQLALLTSDGVVQIERVAEVCANVTAYTSGTINSSVNE